MPSSVSKVSRHFATEKVKRKAQTLSTLSSKRKAADIDDDADTWMPPDNPIRMMAESGTFDIRHRILESCVSRAAGHRPAVVKDMATARLSVVAVRALVKKMKGKKRDLDVTERKDLMILERKLRVSEAYQNGYFGMPLKNATETAYKRMRDRESFEGKEPFSEHWEEEKKKALAYYIGMQKEGEEFDYCDWSRFEMEIRAEFETAKAEEALPRMVKDAYKEGQYRRIKRRKLASSPYGTSGEDAPMFEGSSNVDEEVIEPAVSTSDCKEPEPGDGNGEDIHSPVFNLSGDVQAHGHTGALEQQTKPVARPDVQLDMDSPPATSNDQKHLPDQDLNVESGMPGSMTADTNGRVKASKSGKPKKRSTTDCTFAGIKKQKGQGRKRAPLCDGGMNTAFHPTHPLNHATSQHATYVLSPTLEDNFQEMHPDRDELLKQQTPPSNTYGEMKKDVHAHASDEDDAFDRSVAEFEAMMAAEAIAEGHTGAVAPDRSIDTDLEPECCETPFSLAASCDRRSDTEHDCAEDASLRDDARNHEYDEGETQIQMETVETITGLPRSDVDFCHEAEIDETAKCNGSITADPESAFSKEVTDQVTAPSPDDVDKDCFDIINSASKTWIRAVKQRIADCRQRLGILKRVQSPSHQAKLCSEGFEKTRRYY